MNKEITLLPLLVVWGVLIGLGYCSYSLGDMFFEYAFMAESIIVTISAYGLGAIFYLGSIAFMLITLMAIIFGLAGRMAP